MIDPTLETLRIMAGFERRLNTYIGHEVTHCGYDERVQVAIKSRERMFDWLQKEIDVLARKAGWE